MARRKYARGGWKGVVEDARSVRAFSFPAASSATRNPGTESLVGERGEFWDFRGVGKLPGAGVTIVGMVGSSVAVTRWLPLVLVGVGLALYLNTLGNPFIFDDEPSILGDATVRDLGAALRESPASMFTLAGDDPRPLVTISLAVNYAIDGYEPRGYHLFNTAVHIAGALALFGLVRRTLLLPRWRERFEASAAWWAFAVALLWVAHPLNTQAVTYVIQRAESMMGMFFLVAMYAAVRQWESPPGSSGTPGSFGDSSASGGGIGWGVACVAAALLGSWCKQVIVVLPVVLLAYDWVMLRGEPLNTWVKRRGVTIAALFVVSGWLAARSVGVATDETSSAGFVLPITTPLGYLISQCWVVLHYLRLAFWPDVLVLDYFWLPSIPKDTPAEAVGGLVMTRVLPFVIPMVLLFGASVYGLARRRWWGFCGVAFFLILAPTSSIMPIADLAVEHRMYLPLTCVVALAVFAVGTLLRMLAPEHAHKIGGGAVLLIAAALGSRTFIRNYDYASAVRIWDQVVVDRPHNPRGWQNLGAALLTEGRKEDAMICFEQVLAILPTYAAAHAGLGEIYMNDKRPVEALAHYERAIAIAPEHAGYQYEYGWALLQVGEWERARAQFLKAIELQPVYPKAYNNLGLSYLPVDRPDDAIVAFEKSIAQQPGQVDAYINLSVTHEKRGRFDEALRVMEAGAAHERDGDVAAEQIERFNRRLNDLRQRATRAPVEP